MSLSFLFKSMADNITARYRGRLNVFPNGYIFSDKGYKNPQGVSWPAKPDASGRLISLVHLKTVNGCPQPPEGDFPKNKFGSFWVPFSKCRKCPHHIKRRRGQPYPCCAILREKAQSGPTPAAQLSDTMNRAVEKAKEILS